MYKYSHRLFQTKLMCDRLLTLNFNLEGLFLKNIKPIISWILAFLWMIVIFLFSAQTGEESAVLSESILFNIAIPLLDFFSIPTYNVEFISFLVRKGAHVVVFFVLAILFINAILASNLFKKISHSYICAIILSFLYACLDEFHQSFVPDRNMSFGDVVIDTVGACLGLAIFYSVSKKLHK